LADSQNPFPINIFENAVSIMVFEKNKCNDFVDGLRGKFSSQK
jgi:hypothetical protein